MLAGSGKVGERGAENHYGKKVAAAERVGDRIKYQDGGKSKHLPELLVGNARKQSHPEKTGEQRDGERQQKLKNKQRENAAKNRAAAAGHKSNAGENDGQNAGGGGASPCGDAEQYADAERAETVTEGRFDYERGFQVLAQIELVQHGQNDRTAQARDRRGDQKRRHGLQLHRVNAEKCDGRERQAVAEDGENHAAEELLDRVAQVQFETRSEENQDQRERAEAANYLREVRSVNPVQHRT